MTQTTVPPVRVRARVLVFVVAGIASLSLAFACATTKRAPGEECLKSEDCLSGICSQLVCAAAPPLTSSEDNNTEAGAADTGPAPEAGPEAAAETGPGPEAGDDSSDGAVEASGD